MMTTTTKRRAVSKVEQRKQVAAEVLAGTRCPCEEHEVRPPTDFTAINCANNVCRAPLLPRGRFLHWGHCDKCKAVYWDSGLGVVEVDDRSVVDGLRRFL
jgi:hypothetical protein